MSIIPGPISQVLPKKFLDYAMSVIVSRALPDVRDGLKPVHRRILYSMHEQGITHNKPFKKCARTVGDVLGKYHPHGDTSVYGAMVILAQDFSTRYPLIDGHGNFGSVDGDSAAAMRYTESRLERVSTVLLDGLNKNTVDFAPNYDGEELEPTVLPTLLPNLLANGSTGIAVGMATSIPPHNLRDLYRAIYYLIDMAKSEQEADLAEVIKLIKAPDFPTGGKIVGLKGIRKGYETGKGNIIIRSRIEVEENKKGTSIIITELPYKVNKARLIEEIDSLTKDAKTDKGKTLKDATFTEIRDVRDESDRTGIRVVIELKKDANPQLVINKLLKHTRAQISFSMNMLAIVNGKPEVMNVKTMLEHFLAHAASVVIRRTQFELEKVQKRLNIVDGVLKCFETDPDDPSQELLDKIISIMRKADNPIEDIINLGFNAEQTEYITQMRLTSLTKSSQEKLLKEKEDLLVVMEKCNAILNDNNVLLDVMKQDFIEVEDKYGDERMTEITYDDSDINEIDLVEDETLIITYTTDDLIKSVEEGEYKSQKRGGKGTKATNTKEDEIVKFMLTTNSKDDILFFTTEGRCHVLKAYKISKSSRIARGKSINNYLNLNPGEKVINILTANLEDKEKFLLFITRQGIIKKLSLEQLSTRMTVTKVVGIREGDALRSVLLVSETDNVLIVTSLGQSLRIDLSAGGSKAIRAMGRAAAGVTGINVATGDEVVDMAIVKDTDLILTITENGLGKRTIASEWRVIGRGGKGIIAHSLSEKTGRIVAVVTASNEEELFIATEQGLITRIKTSSIRSCGRSSIGVKAINLNNNDKVASISKIQEVEDEEE